MATTKGPSKAERELLARIEARAEAEDLAHPDTLRLRQDRDDLARMLREAWAREGAK